MTTPRHEPMALDDPTRVVLDLADGTRDAAEIARALAEWIDGGALSLTPEARAALARREAQIAFVRGALSRLAALGFFERPNALPQAGSPGLPIGSLTR